MSHKRLLILSFSHIASDARVLKQVRHFASTMDVTTCGYGPPPAEGVKHVSLDGVSTSRSWTRRDIAFRRFKKIYWNTPAIVEAKSRLASRGQFDVILANDVETVGLALALSPVSGVHADIHEYAPRQNEEIVMWRIFNAPYITWMCRQFLHKTSSMTTVGTGIAKEYERQFGVSPEVATNAAPFANLEPGIIGSPIRLVHSGAAHRNRHLEVLIEAAECTVSSVTLDLFLVPSDPEHLAELGRLAASTSKVRVMPPVPYADLLTKLNEYDIGLHVIPPTNFNNRWALPNKFFDYVQARLGLIVGPSPEMARILEDYNLGAVTDDFSAAALTRTLDRLAHDEVAKWKDASHTSATALSAEAQVMVWDKAISRILASGE
jgi:hypothetical protein